MSYFYRPVNFMPNTHFSSVRRSLLALPAALLMALPLASSLAQEATGKPAPKSISPSKTDTQCYELRTYYAAPGKLEALEKRFKDHTIALFEKHGIHNVIYLKPQAENKENKFLYVVRYPSKEAGAASFKAFGQDPAWKAVVAETEKDGKLVVKITRQFMQSVDFSPTIELPTAKDKERVYELRTYTTTPGNLPRLHQRFRAHTTGLFAKHGMTNYAYWELLPAEPGQAETLIYLLSHKSKEACAESFAAFRADPTWVAAKAASEKEAGGSLTVPDGVKSELLTLTDYSPLGKDKP